MYSTVIYEGVKVKRKKKTGTETSRVQVNFRLSHSIKTRLQQIADDNGWTMTQAIAHIVRSYKL